jgi:hypothetical protein
MFSLPDRKSFADSIVRIFKTYRDVSKHEDEDVDACLNRTANRELFPYQKLVRDYLVSETPYRGLLLYHGLGSGKTCSAISVAESLLSTKKIFVMAPASLLLNFRSELATCGDPIYKLDQHWSRVQIKQVEEREKAKAMGISDKFLDNYGSYYTTSPNIPPNYKTLPLDQQKEISAQINDLIDQRFTFIAYNGISKNNVDQIFPPDQPRMFDDSVIIIDEAHNFMGYVLKESVIKSKIYDMMYHSKNSKVVLLSGTPVINSPLEISYMMNLLRGPIERVIIPTTQVISWDEGMMTSFFKSLKDVDTIEYNSVKRYILLTRNPPFFETVYNEKNERIAVKYNKDFPQIEIKEWVELWRQKFQEKFGEVQLASDEKILTEELECLPTKFEDFVNTYIDGLAIKNSLMFQRRIQGLVSYYKGADERLVAKEVNPDNRLVKVPMSDGQFLKYLTKRWAEVQQDSRRNRKTDLNDDQGSYRTNSRLVCNFALPPEFDKMPEDINLDEDQVPDKSEALAKIKADPKRFLEPEKLKEFSPKMAQILKDLKQNMGEAPYKSQFVYSVFKELEGLGLFAAVLEANGFQEYKIKKEGGVYIEDPELKPGVPAFAFFKGTQTETEKVTRDLYRQIFNNQGFKDKTKFSGDFPQTLKDSLKVPLCVLLISKAGAEGISLENVRNVYIMEPHWNPAILDQVVGRAIRICSHARLPILDRTVDVKIYMAVFSAEQLATQEGPNVVPIRRNDTETRRYEGDSMNTFMTTDESLYNLAYRKGRIAKNISILLKQAAIDCEIHRKLHSKEKPVLQCMRFDTTYTPDDLAYKPNYQTDEKDSAYLRNIVRKKRRLQKVKVKGIDMIIDPDTNEIFDAEAFEDNNRLIRLGTRIAPNEIKWFI